MAILRDSKTGQGVASGTPEELLAIWEKTDSELIWDDVGENFDPEKFKKEQENRLASLESTVKMSNLPGEVRESLEEQIGEIRENLDPSTEDVKAVDSKVKKAHEQAEALHG